MQNDNLGICPVLICFSGFYSEKTKGKVTKTCTYQTAKTTK